MFLDVSIYLLTSSSVTFPRLISSDLILACSDKILVDSCSDDISKEKKAIEIGKKFNTITIIDQKEEGVNQAVSLADEYLLENNFNASVVFPQDIPNIKTQDIDFMLKHQLHPNFAIIIPSRKFDGTNALVRMPVDLMKTHYDDNSYRKHMLTAKEHTMNVAMVFVKRIMLDVDSQEDLEFLLEQNEKPDLIEKIKKNLN